MGSLAIQYEAVCDSEGCCPHAYVKKPQMIKLKNGKRVRRMKAVALVQNAEVIKDVPKTTVFCPDCNAALFWRVK